MLGLDLRDLYTGGLSWRRLGVVLSHLGPESAYLTAVRESLTPEELQAMAARSPDHHGVWSQADMLLARIGDLVSDLIWMNSSGETPRPDPYPRPGVDRTVVKAISPYAEAYLREVERLHGAEPAPDWKPNLA